MMEEERRLLLPFFTRARLARYNRPGNIAGCAPLTRLPCDAAAKVAPSSPPPPPEIVARTRVQRVV